MADMDKLNNGLVHKPAVLADLSMPSVQPDAETYVSVEYNGTIKRGSVSLEISPNQSNSGSNFVQLGSVYKYTGKDDLAVSRPTVIPFKDYSLSA